MILIVIFTFSGCGNNDMYIPQGESPKLIKNDNIIKGIWFSYLEFDEYLCGKDENSFRETFNNIVDNCKSVGINTMFIQVRSHADAYYNSNLFPTSSHLSGQIGKDISFDALKVMIEICHNKGVDIHAWVNPYRAYALEEMKNLTVENTIVKWYNEKRNLFEENGRLYLNPASEEVIDFVCEGVKEILPYNVDGIHFDDYFYPTTDNAIDYNEFINSGYNDLQQFRLDNVSKLISSVYKTVKSYDNSILFGVSPQGNIDNNYKSLYADVNRWCREDGFIDYIAPQLYYGFNNQTAPFIETVNKWEDIITNPKVKLIGGLAGYKIGRVDTYAGSNGQNEWIEENDILKRQVEVLSKTHNYGGIIIYRYSSLFSDNSDKTKKEVETLVPLLIN